MNTHFDLRFPKSVEQLATDCHDKLDNDAQCIPPSTIEIIPSTELLLDMAQRILRLEGRV